MQGNKSYKKNYIKIEFNTKYFFLLKNGGILKDEKNYIKIEFITNVFFFWKTEGLSKTKKIDLICTWRRAFGSYCWSVLF